MSINDHGQVAISVPRDEMGDAYLWENGELQLIVRNARVTAVNARGQVMGFPLTDPPNDLAFVWEHGQVTSIEPPPPYTASRALALNDNGQVAGLVGWGGVTRVFVWQHGVTRLLPSPAGHETRAYGINNRGDIVGQLTLPSGLNRAVMWRDGALIDLGTLGDTEHPMYESTARDINDRAQVVGFSTAPPDGHTRPFLWSGVDGVMRNLGRPLGDNCAGPTSAQEINNRGQVVGGGGFTLRAYMWEP